MHSITNPSAPTATAVSTIRTCSMTFARPDRKTGYSSPSGKIMRASVPVVFAQVRSPPARMPAAMRRVTLDLPRVPFT